MDKKDNEQYHTYIHIVFSDSVKDREQMIKMMMDKLSFDSRVEDWSYVTSLATINAKLKVYWQDAKDERDGLRDFRQSIKVIASSALQSYGNRKGERADVDGFITIMKWIMEEIDDSKHPTKALESEE